MPSAPICKPPEAPTPGYATWPCPHLSTSLPAAAPPTRHPRTRPRTDGRGARAAAPAPPEGPRAPCMRPRKPGWVRSGVRSEGSVREASLHERGACCAAKRRALVPHRHARARRGGTFIVDLYFLSTTGKPTHLVIPITDERHRDGQLVKNCEKARAICRDNRPRARCCAVKRCRRQQLPFISVTYIAICRAQSRRSWSATLPWDSQGHPPTKDRISKDT